MTQCLRTCCWGNDSAVIVVLPPVLIDPFTRPLALLCHRCGSQLVWAMHRKGASADASANRDDTGCPRVV